MPWPGSAAIHNLRVEAVHCQQHPCRRGSALKDVEHRLGAFVEQTDGIDVGKYRPLAHIATNNRCPRDVRKSISRFPSATDSVVMRRRMSV